MKLRSRSEQYSIFGFGLSTEKRILIANLKNLTQKKIDQYFILSFVSGYVEEYICISFLDMWKDTLVSLVPG